MSHTSSRYLIKMRNGEEYNVSREKRDTVDKLLKEKCLIKLTDDVRINTADIVTISPYFEAPQLESTQSIEERRKAFVSMLDKDHGGDPNTFGPGRRRWELIREYYKHFGKIDGVKKVLDEYDKNYPQEQLKTEEQKQIECGGATVFHDDNGIDYVLYNYGKLEADRKAKEAKAKQAYAIKMNTPPPDPFQQLLAEFDA